MASSSTGDAPASPPVAIVCVGMAGKLLLQRHDSRDEQRH